jgi:hypothetical protein
MNGEVIDMSRNCDCGFPSFFPLEGGKIEMGVRLDD